MFNKTWINSYEAWAAQRQKDVDLEKYSSLELNQAFCQFYGELRRVDGELPFLIDLVPEMCSQLQVLKISSSILLADPPGNDKGATPDSIDQSNQI